ncbi:MAG: hypothetical protein ABI632_07860 [Pseudolysinimonas sp.]
MTIPKWLLPVIGVIAAIAVGIAAALIGMRFTAPTTPVLTTETAPVIAPADPAGDDPYAVSQTVGAADIVTPGQPGIDEIDAGSQATIDALDAADGYPVPGTSDAPPADEPAPAAADDPAAPLAADDPCSSSDPPADCPVGVTGIVLADTRVPEETTLVVVVDPATHSGFGIGVYCERDGEDAPGSIWVGIGTTVPMDDITLTYAPIGDPSHTLTATTSTSATDLNAWNHDYATRHAYREHYWFFQHCVQLTGLQAGEYTLTATGTDILGRAPLPVTRTFDSRGNPTEPPLSVVPLNSALLYVSVPSPSTVDGQRPFIRAWVVADDEATDCSAFDSRPDLPKLSPQTTSPVDASWLDAQNYDPSFLSRDVVVYSVPEGSQVVICARWFSTPDHSWQSAISRQRVVTVSSPDTVTPTIGIESIALGRLVQPDDIKVSVTMPGGLACGPEWDGPDVAQTPGTFDVGVGLCDASTRGFDGRVVVTTSVNLGEGHRVDHSQVLQLERRHCTGTCAVPADSHYQVDLATVRTGTGLCSGEGCTPPSTETSLGRVNLVVQWAQGHVNNLADWMIGGVDGTLPGGTESEAPQFDTNVFPDTSHTSDGLQGRISFPVVLDRTGHYRAHLSGTCFPDGATRVITGEVLSSDPSAAPLVAFSGLCPSANYAITLQVWDDSSHQNTYEFDSPDHRWSHALVTLSAVPINVTAHVQLSSMNRDHNAFGINSVGMEIGAQGVASYGTDPHCSPSSDQHGVDAHFTTVVGQADAYAVSMRVPVFTQNTSFAPTGGPDRYCGFERQSYGYATVTGTVTFAELMHGVTLHGNPVYEPSMSGLGNFPDLVSYITLQGTVRH